MAVSQLTGKVVVITGASAGVGEACARLFAKQNAKLVLLARGEDKLNALASELAQQTEVLAVPMDVANAEACTSLFQQVEQAFGDVHVLINNAGLHHRGNLAKQQPDNMAAMVDVNLRSPIHLSSLALPYMLNAKEGAIINIGSLAGLAPLQGAATYSATKAGLRTFTYALADELIGTGVSASVVSPGPIDTGFIMEEIDKVEDIVFSQEMSTAEQVAQAALDLVQSGDTEIAMPAIGAKLATLGYLFPNLRRKIRPKLYEKGRKNKEKYRQRNQH